jgi:translation initiation factor 1A
MRSKSRFRKLEEVKQTQAGEEIRVRLPRRGEVLGIVEIRLGFGKSRVVCSDGKIRICRVPGALKRRLWVRPDTLVLVKPWEFEGDKKGDILYSYKKNQEQWLRRRGYLKNLIEQEEF